MKIEHLLEMPQVEAVTAPPVKRSQVMAQQKELAKTNAATQAKQDAVDPKVGGVPNFTGLPQATTGDGQFGVKGAVTPTMKSNTSTTPTGPAADSLAGWKSGPTASAQQTDDAPAVWKNNRDLDAPATTKPGAVEPKAPEQDTGSTTVAPDATGRVDPTFSPDELDQVKKNAGIVPQEPEQLQATNAEEPAAEPAAPKEPGALKKAWDYANSAQSGDDVTKFGSGVADAGGSLVRGANRAIGGTADVATNLAQGVGKVATAASQGLANTIGAFGGGIKSGFNQAANGRWVGNGPSAVKQATGFQSNAPARTSGGGAGDAGGAGGDDLEQLKSTIQQMDQRLRKGGL